MSKEKIVLSIGDPDVEAPDYVFEAAYEKMKQLHATGLNLGGLKVDRAELYDRQ